jgi:GMP synthase (glutamine-hydrolysing)
MLSGDIGWDRLLEAMATITAEVPGLNRCMYNLGPEPPRGAKPVAATMTRSRLDLLREADHCVMQGLRRHGLYDEIWQCPTVLLPLELDDSGGEMVVIRPVQSRRAMTAQAVPLPETLLNELRHDILGLSGVTSLALDLTSKPPGTIEWE